MTDAGGARNWIHRAVKRALNRALSQTESLGLKYTEKGGLFKKGLYQTGKHDKAWRTKTEFKSHSAPQWISW